MNEHKVQHSFSKEWTAITISTEEAKNGCYIQKKIGAHIPKNGRIKAMTTVDATRPVLSMTATIVSFKNPSGRNSSKLRANGFNSKANLFAVKDETIPYLVRQVTINIILDTLALDSLKINFPRILGERVAHLKHQKK
jgi:hypothetical protein